MICDMSVDGYVTGPNDSRENPFGDGAGMLHDWIVDAATDEDRAILQDLRDGVGAVVVGRTPFDQNERSRDPDSNSTPQRRFSARTCRPVLKEPARRDGVPAPVPFRTRIAGRGGRPVRGVV